MKKILLVLAAVISMQVANAQQQVKSAAAAKAAVESAQKAANDAKKATKVNTWMKLGSTLMDAYYAPQGSAWIGASAQDLMLVMGNDKPSSEEAVVIGGQQFTKQVYDSRNYYFNQNGQLQMIEVTAPVIENALDKALAAYTKAYEVDAKHSKAKDIAEAVKNIGQKYTDEAYNAYTFGNYAKASEFFQKAAEASSAVPGIQVDTNAIYNAAFTAYMVGDYDRAKTWFEKSIGAGYDGENGEAYAKLADIAEKAGDIEKSKGILEKAFMKYPQSQSILIGLINYYTLHDSKNTDRLFDLLDEAKKNEPGNASLYYVEGNINNQLGRTEAAIAAYDKCAEVNPNYEFGYIGKGIMFYNKAVELQDAASNEFDDAKWQVLQAEFEKNLKGCIEPFEKAFEITKDESIKSNVAEYLKNACFRFRTESQDYMTKYEKYAAAAGSAE
ncbi:MAG: hypothetical protein K6F25_07085 [Bacteroidales bacterium]|nr:hypothetical protein [Bacteroidales bacterium]